jgi:hypothetical protein
MKFNRDYVFVTLSGNYMIMRKIKKKNRIYYQSTKKDAVEFLKLDHPGLPLLGNFLWPETIFKRVVDNWICVSEL